jgi:ABC-type polysaccharide/polyol phosphate transport system ATPase subunit
VTTAIDLRAAGIRFLFDRNRRVVTPMLARLRRRGSETWGIRDVTLEIGPGEGVAILGLGGSGKTTLLRMIAGIYTPDVGTVTVRGRLATLLSTEAGLLPMLTGRENALLLAVLAGLTRREARFRLDEVGRESRLETYFDRPVSAYSQGMRARLGLAVAEQVEPEILLLDEVHEALDHSFRDVLEQRAGQILMEGGIVIAAGHDHPMLRRLCNRAVWLHDGRLRAYGGFDDVQRMYLGDG